jgi:hypothetical protein
MDPIFWKNLKRSTEAAVEASGTPGVRLRGGPMDGWLVLVNAPSLDSAWYTTWPWKCSMCHRRPQAQR